MIGIDVGSRLHGPRIGKTRTYGNDAQEVLKTGGGVTLLTL
jgi:hypothetical protein